MEQLPTELIAHIMKFLIPEVNPFLKFTTQGVHSSHLHPVSFSSSTTSSSSSSSAPAVVFPSSSSAALTSPRRSFLPSLHLLPHLHCKSRSGSWPSRGDGSGGGSRGKKRGKNSKNQRWWDDWQSLRLVCKNWNVIATDPRLIIHIRRHQEVFFAQIAEQAKRYSEMVTAIKNVAMLGVELTVEERNLLSRAYKHQITNKRESWERIVECEKKEKRSIRSDSFADHIIKYRSALEAEICFVCRDLLAVLDAYVIPHTVSAEARVFFLKMKGDYYRHLAEFGSEGERKEAIQNAVNYFTQASDIAILELPPAHPIRLSLALNFSLFQYYILKQSEKACTLAKEAFDDAIAELDTLDEESYKNSSRTMQVLRDCLTFRSGANSSAKRKGRSKAGGSEV